MFRTIRSGLVLVLAATALVGCSTTEADGVDGAGQHVQVKPGTHLFTAKLYAEPNTQPDASCDQYTELTLTQTTNGFQARLESKLSATSACRVFVEPNPRTFAVKASEDCGSKVYVGSGASGAIEILDHRTRLCEDLRLDTLEVETSVNGKRVVLYGSLANITSHSSQPPANPTCTSGGKAYQPGATFPDKDGCNTCTCGHDGSIFCTEIACN